MKQNNTAKQLAAYADIVARAEAMMKDAAAMRRVLRKDANKNLLGVEFEKAQEAAGALWCAYGDLLKAASAVETLRRRLDLQAAAESSTMKTA